MKKDIFKLIFAFLVVAILSATGCSLVDNQKPDLVISITDEIQLTWKEDLSNSNDEILLTLTSTDTFTCPGIEYAFHQVVIDDLIKIQIDGLRNPDECHGTIHEAQSTIRLPLDLNLYRFEVHIGENIRNNGALRKEGEKFTLFLPEKLGIHIPYSELKRIPNQIMWGEISSNQPLETAENWLTDKLNNLGNQVQLPDGYYGHFLKELNNFSVFPEEDGTFNYTFSYQLLETESELSNVVEAFKNTFDETIKIRCFTFDGKEYH